MSARTLQQHGRSIASGVPVVHQRQGADCGELISSIQAEEPESDPDEGGLSRTEQIGIALAILVLLVGGGAVAAGGL